MAAPVTRRTTLLLILLAISLVFAGWQWFRPYEWSSAPGARFRIVHSSLKRDHSHVWLDLYLKKSGEADHDLSKPVFLRLADGRELEPADTTLEGDEGEPVRALGFRFWLEEKDLAGPLDLTINDGVLSIRTGNGLPEIKEDGVRFFTTRNW
jgi:hypothetical protein